MYHFDDNVGASPDCETVNIAPSEPYVGLLEAVNSSDAPLVKSMVRDFPRAGFAGQPDCVVGLHVEYVCAVDGNAKTNAAITASRSGDLMARKLPRANMAGMCDIICCLLRYCSALSNV